MRWYLDGQLYFTVNSAGGNAALPGWHSTGRGAGRDSPFDQARTAAACVGGALPWSAAACRIALPGAPVTAVAPRPSPPFTACLPGCLPAGLPPADGAGTGQRGQHLHCH
jgi:hypothetical protein